MPSAPIRRFVGLPLRTSYPYATGSLGTARDGEIKPETPANKAALGRVPRPTKTGQRRGILPPHHLTIDLFLPGRTTAARQWPVASPFHLCTNMALANTLHLRNQWRYHLRAILPIASPMSDADFRSAKCLRDRPVRLVPSVTGINREAAQIAKGVGETIPAAVV